MKTKSETIKNRKMHEKYRCYIQHSTLGRVKTMVLFKRCEDWEPHFGGRRTFAGTEQDVCAGSSDEASKPTDGRSKDCCDAPSGRLSEPLFRDKIDSALSNSALFSLDHRLDVIQKLKIG